MEKIEALAKFLEIEDLDQIEVSKYDNNLLIVNPHTRKFGDSPDQLLDKVNLVKQALDQSGVSKSLTFTIEDFTPNMYTPLSNLFCNTCEDLTKIGLHDLVNTLYFLCGGSKGQEFLAGSREQGFQTQYRDLFEGKAIEDTRRESEVSDGEYLVLNNYEADQAFEDYIANYIEECVLDTLPKQFRIYFDSEAFTRDCQINDGRGSSLASYDGEENEIKDPDTNEYYFIYRTN